MRTLKIGTWLGAAAAAMLLASGPVRAGSDSGELIRALSVSDGSAGAAEILREHMPGRGVEGRAGKGNTARDALQERQLLRELAITDGGPYYRD